MTDQTDGGPIEFERTIPKYFKDGSDYTFTCHLRWSDYDRLQDRATAADLVAALQANAGLRAEVLGKLLELPEAVQAHVDMTAQLMRARGELAELKERNELAKADLYNIGATRGDVATRAKTARCIYDFSISDRVEADDKIERLESELAEAKAELVEFEKSYDANQADVRRMGQELAAERARARELEEARKEVTGDFADVANWLLTCGWHLPGFAHDRIGKLKQRLLDASGSPQQPTTDAEAPCGGMNSVAYWERTEHECRTDDGTTCVLCQRDTAAAERPSAADEDCPPGARQVGVYLSANGDTLAFPGGAFTTVRACRHCGALITGGPTACVHCVAKQSPEPSRKAEA